MKLFATVGNAFQPFDRLLHLVEAAVTASSLSIDGVCQVGFSQARPAGLTIVRLLEREDFDRHVVEADVVICHAGVGAMATAIRMGHRPIALARRASLGEHVDDHQLDVVRQLLRMGRIFSAENGIDDALLRRAQESRRKVDDRLLTDLREIGGALTPHATRGGDWRRVLLAILARCAPKPMRLR